MKEERPLVLHGVNEVLFRGLLLMCAVCLYANTFKAGYVWDDRAAIISNKDVTQQRALLEVFSHDFWGQEITDDLSHKSYRPVTVLSFRLNHMLHGLHASGYHVTNVIIYAFTVLLSYELGLRVLSRGAARFSSLLFCFHPIHVEAVASLVGRADSLCGVFYLGAILAYIPCLKSDSGSLQLQMRAEEDASEGIFKERKSKNITFYFFLAIALGIAASFTKEIGVTVFGVIPCLEVSARINHHRRDYIKLNKYNQNPRTFVDGLMICLRGVYTAFLQPTGSLVRTIIILVVLVVLMRVRVYVNGETKVFEWTILENHIMHLPSRKERFLSYAQTHFWYFFKLCFPRYLCFDYGFACIPTIHEFSDLRNVFSLLTYGGLMAVAAYAISRAHVPIITAMVLLIVPLLPALNIFLSVGTILAERLLFLPSVGFCFLLGQIVVDECQHLWLSLPPLQKSNGEVGETKGKEARKSLFRHRGHASLHSILCLLCGLSAVRVITRNVDWNSELAIYGSALSVCPLSAKALANYGVLSMNGATIHKAVISVLSATDVYKEQAPAFLNSGVGLEKLGLPARSVWYFERAAARRGGHIGKTFAYLGHVLYEWSIRHPYLASSTGVSSSAIKGATEVLRNMSMHAMDQAFKSNFALPSLLHARGSLALDTGDFHYAVECLNSALEKTQAARATAADVPREDLVDEVLTYNQLGNAYSYLGDYDGAIEAFKRGIAFAVSKSRPSSSISAYTSLLVNFGSVLRQAKQPEEARRQLVLGLENLKRVGEEPPPALYNNLGLVEEDAGNLEAAEKYMSMAVEGNKRHRESSRESAFMLRTGDTGGDLDAIDEVLQANLQKVRQQRMESELRK